MDGGDASQVVLRRDADDAEVAGGEPDPLLAPSITKVLDRLRSLYESDPEPILDIAVEESGMLIHLELDPSRETEHDEFVYRFGVDVDSPGDAVRGG